MKEKNPTHPVLKHPIRIKILLKKNSIWSKFNLDNTGMQRNSRVNDHPHSGWLGFQANVSSQSLRL